MIKKGKPKKKKKKNIAVHNKPVLKKGHIFNVPLYKSNHGLIPGRILTMTNHAKAPRIMMTTAGKKRASDAQKNAMESF